jgi:hypothetical protein
MYIFAYSYEMMKNLVNVHLSSDFPPKSDVVAMGMCIKEPMATMLEHQQANTQRAMV